MSTFTDTELDHPRSQPLGRLAIVGVDGSSYELSARDTEAEAAR